MKLSNDDLKFIKTYHKKSYDDSENVKSDEYDIVQRQAPLKIFNKVNRLKNCKHKYKFFAHRRKIRSMLPESYANKVEELVLEVNDHELSKTEC